MMQKGQWPRGLVCKLLTLLGVGVLTGCATFPEPPVVVSASSIAPEPVSEPEPDYSPEIYVPERMLTAQETVAAYFEQLYQGYQNLKLMDLSSILYLEERAVSNSVVWNQMLTQRRRLLYEHGLCYVETEQFPYTITYFDATELLDERMEYWQEYRPIKEGEIALHFIINGSAGEAYPPFMPTNAQHTIRLKQYDGTWKITFHYFPGSNRKFVRAGRLELPSEEDMLADLYEEFAPADSAVAPELPLGATAYDPASAVQYALTYTELPNPDFYHVGDWMGNCANFTSQCISAGFGKRMTDSWYASSGGTPAWENVKYFWEYSTEGGELQGQELAGIADIAAGDLLQTAAGPYRRSGGDPPDDYSHSMLMVDDGKFKLAQNTPACFVYYSDMVNTYARFFRPMSIA